MAPRAEQQSRTTPGVTLSWAPCARQQSGGRRRICGQQAGVGAGHHITQLPNLLWSQGRARVGVDQGSLGNQSSILGARRLNREFGDGEVAAVERSSLGWQRTD